MVKVLVDSDILIDYSKGWGVDLEKVLTNPAQEAYITPVNIAEFLNDKNLKSKNKYAQALEFLRSFLVEGADRSVGEKTGELLRSKQIDYLGDALIAAVCLEKDMQLMTRNVKHFKRVKGLKFYGVEKKRS